MKTIIGAQGEITIIKIAAMPDGMKTRPAERAARGGWIISHSESGHHHILTGGDVVEREPEGAGWVRRLYATLTEPARLEQSAAHPHEAYTLEPGVYEFRLSREYDPFADQIRQVAD